MLVVRIYKDNARYLANRVNVTRWENCIKQFRYYFSNIGEIRKKIISGEIIDFPYLTFQKDRRIDKKKVRNERRKIYN